MLSQESLHGLAKLAGIALTPEEETQMARDLAPLLESMAGMVELDTAGVEGRSHVLGQVNVFREDVPEGALDREELLSGALMRAEGYFVVPKTLDEGGKAR